MGTPSADVEQYLKELEHPLKEGVLQLRAAILACDPAITEHVKWNAPSFCHGGQDRVTFRLQPRGKLQLIFHRGAKVRADTAGFTFEDPTGLMTWPAPDRAVVDFPDLAAVTARQAQVVALVRRWVLT
ncbi:DUF1801 domain-containing protein [Actinoplanes auranticolor]|uniref:YdhG-like domain-containing protein n=1 Tax=Actinoplanes auranticolor TaxID=47988 RepID=A0A919S4P9_9ACTN|nr:DUF1801 domain-containing protein [Actinoplanes auranticolor]GIM65155.1 hypothetical protein Aau02nite_15100 [Actinoplanes auranticolor]